MKHKQILFSVVFLLVVELTSLQAQNNVNSTGGNASGSEGSTNYSIGQVFSATSTGTSGSVTEGVQQAYEISVATGIGEAKGINLLITAYPNPTTDYLTLEVKDVELEFLHFQMYDVNGNILQREKIVDSRSQINMSSYTSSVYFVKVLKNNNPIKEFKIMKN